MRKWEFSTPKFFDAEIISYFWRAQIQNLRSFPCIPIEIFPFTFVILLYKDPVQRRGFTDLFHGAAAMSGADVSYHQVITNPWLAYNNTIKLGRQVGCTQYTA